MTTWTVAYQAPLSMGFSREAYWSGLPLPSPGTLSNPGIKPMSPVLAGGFFTTEPPQRFIYYNYCCSATTLCPTFHDPMGCSMPGLPVPYHLLEFAQVHVHCIGGVIQPSHPLSPSSPSAFNLSQHQIFFPVSWLFVSSGQSIGVSASALVLPVNIQG